MTQLTMRPEEATKMAATEECYWCGEEAVQVLGHRNTDNTWAYCKTHGDNVIDHKKPNQYFRRHPVPGRISKPFSLSTTRFSQGDPMTTPTMRHSECDALGCPNCVCGAPLQENDDGSGIPWCTKAGVDVGLLDGRFCVPHRLEVRYTTPGDV